MAREEEEQSRVAGVAWVAARTIQQRGAEEGGMFVIGGMESRYFHRGSLEGIVDMNEDAARVRDAF